MARFKYGDYVQVNGHKAKVVSIWQNQHGEYICSVEFTDGSRLDYKEMHLKAAVINKPTSCVPPRSYKPTGFRNLKMSINGNELVGELEVGVNIFFNKKDNDKTCPLCGDEWHWIPSPFRGMKEVWYDCVKCNLSRKDIKKQLESEDDEF